MRGLVFILALSTICSLGFAQITDNLIVAPEVLLNGNTPPDLQYKPGRILDDNTIWFCGVKTTAPYETYIFRSIDGGATFTHNATPISARAAQMDAFDSETAIVADAAGKIYQTTDGGANWAEVYSYTIPPLAPGWFDGVRVLNAYVAVAFGDNEPNGNMQFVRTENKGETWSVITGIDFRSAAYAYYTWGSAACNVDETIWCVATTVDYDSSYLFRSSDAGVTWDSYLIPKNIIPNYPRSVAFTNDNNGLIATSKGLMVKSTDGGATWDSTFNPPVTDSWVNGLTVVPGTDIIVGLDDMGVFYTSDQGANWEDIGIPDFVASEWYTGGVFLNTGFAYVFSNKRVFRFEDQLTGLSEPPGAEGPRTFNLHQNYPNPFNPSTSIEFAIPSLEYVELKVFNLLGQVVDVLVSDKLDRGTYTYSFDGSGLVSGTYFYQLSAGNFKDIKKMVLLK